MNIYQCQKKAKDVGFNKAKFVCFFPKGPVECQWLDAYFGMFKADIDGLRDGFLMVSQVDEMFPDLVCTIPYVEETA